MNLSDSTRRAIRTGFDNVLGLLGLLVVILPLFGDFLRAVGGGSLTGYIATAGVVLAALVVLISKVRNALEDRGVIPAVLKATASDGANPVPQPPAPVDGGYATPRGILLLAVVIVVIIFIAALA